VFRMSGRASTKHNTKPCCDVLSLIGFVLARAFHGKFCTLSLIKHVFFWKCNRAGYNRNNLLSRYLQLMMWFLNDCPFIICSSTGYPCHILIPVMPFRSGPGSLVGIATH
jgi:hypothetical protein